MNIKDELVRFAAYAEKQGMNLSGDDSRFKNHKTAKSWTKWLTEALAFELGMQDDDHAGLMKARGAA